MPIFYYLKQEHGQPIGISRFIDNGAEAAQENRRYEGPYPGGSQVPAVTLKTGEKAFQKIGSAPGKTIAIGLITCGVAIFASTDPKSERGAWVHHIASSNLRPKDLDRAHEELGNPPWDSMLVVFASPNRHDDSGILKLFNTMRDKTIPVENIIIIPSMGKDLDMLGIDNLGRICI